MSLAQLAETSVPQQRVCLTISPTSRCSLEARISFPPEQQRKRLQLTARTKPSVAKPAVDMGEGQQQWSKLNVSLDRKKPRCADCTRPLPDGSSSMLCDRCIKPAAASAATSKPALEQTATQTTAPTASPTPAVATSTHARPAKAPSMPEADHVRIESTNENGTMSLSRSPWSGIFEQVALRAGVGIALGVCAGIGCVSLAFRLGSRRGRP